MALGAVGERVHAGQWEARPPMNLERLHVVPSSGRMATFASAAQPRLMRIAVTVAALADHAPLAAVALVAGSGVVSAAERKAGSGVVEAFSRFSTGHLPARRGMAVPAIHSLGNRIVARGFGASFLAGGVLGHGDRRDPSEAGDTKYDGKRAVHRFPFRRACGLA
jgi:hypothetical protein